jgi:catechol 2,3-dioxygenase-like lactoylglutathione lyase family enzyme
VLSIHHDNAVNIVSAGVNVYVSDLQRAHDWFQDVLGLRMEMSPEGTSSRYAEPHATEQRLTIFRLLPGTAAASHPGKVQLAFSVADLKATTASLRAFGARLVRDSSIEAGCALPSVTVLDPDGNGVVIYER